MTYDDWKATPVDEREVTKPSGPPTVHRCVLCGAATSPQFVAIAYEEYLCQACWRVWDDRRNTQYGDVA